MFLLALIEVPSQMTNIIFKLYRNLYPVSFLHETEIATSIVTIRV